MIKNIWLIFTLLFLFLSCFHLYRATQSIQKMQKLHGVVKSINTCSTGIVEFEKGFGEYIDQLNKDNRQANIATATGYLITAGTALISYFIA